MTVFTITLKRILKNPLTLIFLMLFPALFAVLISASESGKTSDVTHVGSHDFGFIDSDGSALSKTLANQLGMMYNIVEVTKDEIADRLTNDQEVTWILEIPKGYGESILKGEVPQLNGYSLTLSDVAALGSAKAESVTKALMILGTDDEDVIAEWEKSSKLDVTLTDEKDDWGQTAYWFGFYGFVAIFTAYFITKTLTDDKRGGMPDRIGVLPVAPRRYLAEGSLAAFVATEITVALVFAVIGVLLGSYYNPVHLFLLLSLYNLFTICMVMAVFSLAKDLGAASVAMTMLATIFSMLGGVFWPLEFVPDFMQKLAWFSPGYWLSRGLSGIKEITFDGYGTAMLFLGGFTLVALLLGGWKKVQKMEE